ncbi:putative ABC transporter permease [[Actinomadura] parvosata subsp. kistnae]|uniref:ABC transporter permease n=1 Tax=[Actinomadura] parvosata subsp. kistnae TaxID=1909395 RepID=A0A1V0A849_9ACTN|nr:ABC transporter permease [Nonomuraea sp. ATCC 55076]AQZ66385.1 ABC transporter permease [Nonomuraea sp. ATCC 55076]SPL95580.1 putative ABC transporter permease [Actinomadura parvosata subsp. kistnae]
MTVESAAAKEETTPEPRIGRSWHVILPPLCYLAVAAAMVGYTQAVPLDGIEHGSLNLTFLRRRTWEHVELVFFSTVLVLVVALPLGVLLTRRALRRATPVVLALVNLGQATPAVGLVVLLAVLFTIGFWTAVVALFAYSLLPTLRNTMVGIEQVDPRLVDAGRGIGMSAAGVLFKVELPMAVPVILSGVRTTLVLNVGTAGIAAFIGSGGLGDLITTGVSTQRNLVLITGCVLIAVLALIIDWLGGLAQRYLSPKGLT